jgi:hypothetical protein
VSTAPTTGFEPDSIRGLRRVEYDALATAGLLEG